MTDVRTILGLTDEDRIETVASAETLSSEVGHGLATGAVLARGNLEEQVLASPFRSPLPALSGGNLPWGSVESWDDDPTIILFRQVRGAYLASPGAHDLDGGDWILDGREPSWLAIKNDLGEFVASTTGGRVEVHRIERVPREHRPSESFVPSPVPIVPRASIEGMLQGVRAPSWVLDRASRLEAREDAFARAIAVGFLARFGAVTAENASELLTAKLTGGELPADRAASWSKDLDGAVIEEIERLLLEEAGALSDAFGPLRLSRARDAVELPESCRAVFERRDDLESLAFVLRAAGRGSITDEVLRGLDALARTHLSALSGIDIHESELLEAVALQDPEAWWGLA